MSLMRIILGSLVATTTAVLAPVVGPLDAPWSEINNSGTQSSASFAKVVSLEKDAEPSETVCLLGISFESKVYEIKDPLVSCDQYQVGDIISMD